MLPSHDEVLSLVILEAIAHGVAVVTTAAGEILSLLTDGVDAVFVTVANPANIAAGMQKVLKTPGLKQTLARNGRALYLRYFCLSSFFSNIAAVHQLHFGIASHMKDTAPSVQDLQERADSAAMPADSRPGSARRSSTPGPHRFETHCIDGCSGRFTSRFCGLIRSTPPAFIISPR